MKRKRKQVLSTREQEVADLLIEGLSNNEIADRLYISVGTVKTHVGNILDKLDVHTRVMAVVTLLRRKFESLLAEVQAQHENSISPDDSSGGNGSAPGWLINMEIQQGGQQQLYRVSNVGDRQPDTNTDRD